MALLIQEMHYSFFLALLSATYFNERHAFFFSCFYRMLSIEVSRTSSRQHPHILFNIHANLSNGDLRKGPARGIL